MPARVGDRLLCDPEERSAGVVVQVERVEGELDRYAEAALPYGRALLYRHGEGELIESEWPEADDLVAQQPDVSLRQPSRVSQALLHLLLVTPRHGLIDRGEHQVKPDELLDRPVVDRVGQPPSRDGLRLHRPSGELARTQTGGGLSGAEPCHEETAADRRDGEERLVEREHSAAER